MYDYYNLQYLTATNMVICKALLKYGYSGFSLEILEYCDREETLNRENYYLALMQPEYNTAKDASAPFLGRTHSLDSIEKMRGRIVSEEIRAKLSDSMKGESHPFFGKSHSAETKERMSEVMKGKNNPFFGKSHPVETIEKMRNVKKGNKHPLFGIACSEETKNKLSASNGTSVEIMNIITGEIKLYTSGKAAAIALSCSPATVLNYLASGKLYKGTYKLTKQEKGTK